MPLVDYDSDSDVAISDSERQSKSQEQLRPIKTQLLTGEASNSDGDKKSSSGGRRKIVLESEKPLESFPSFSLKTDEDGTMGSTAVTPPTSIASFLPAPKNRKRSSQQSNLTKSHQTRTLGGGLQAKAMFDGEISLPPVVVSAADTATSGTLSASALSQTKVRPKIIPASILARQAKGQKAGSPGEFKTSVDSFQAATLERRQENVEKNPREDDNEEDSLFSVGPVRKKANLVAEAEYKPVFVSNDREKSWPRLPSSSPSLQAVNASQLAKTRDKDFELPSNINVVDFKVSEFYEENEKQRLTAPAQETSRRPVYAIGAGRHQLTSLLRSAQANKEGLEEMFARGKQTKNQTRSKYGF